ncbi:MAG: hypothetical protein ACRYFZ_16115 [Janthinobacterium lividum]
MRSYLLLAGLLTVASCATSQDVPAPTAGPLDSAIRAKTGLTTGKIKFNGPVTFQIGGTNNTASATSVAKAKAPVAAAPHAAATDASTRAGTPWYVFAALVLIGAGVGAWLRGKFSFLNFIK